MQDYEEVDSFPSDLFDVPAYCSTSSKKLPVHGDAEDGPERQFLQAVLQAFKRI